MGLGCKPSGKMKSIFRKCENMLDAERSAVKRKEAKANEKSK